MKKTIDKNKMVCKYQKRWKTVSNWQHSQSHEMEIIWPVNKPFQEGACIRNEYHPYTLVFHFLYH